MRCSSVSSIRTGLARPTGGRSGGEPCSAQVEPPVQVVVIGSQVEQPMPGVGEDDHFLLTGLLGRWHVSGEPTRTLAGVSLLRVTYPGTILVSIPTLLVIATASTVSSTNGQVVRPDLRVTGRFSMMTNPIRAKAASTSNCG